MSKIKISGNYLNNLKSASPTLVHKLNSQGLADTRFTPVQIPPINTDIRFSSIIPLFKTSEHTKLMAMDSSQIPENFDWAHSDASDSISISEKKQLIAIPGNQALCGSCWAISGAGIVADNFVVSGLVNWKPDLSTTWSLACYPQHQCQGGNPALLFENIASGGIVSNHCVDYSWCLENNVCNGSALQHFDEAKMQQAINTLNSQIPNCGCYFPQDGHLVYYIEPNPKNIFIGVPGITEDNLSLTVKKHIFSNGPVMGGFIVFNNFMSGEFSKINGGIYFESGVYDGSGSISFDSSQATTANYKGSHAVAVIGWGIEKNIVVDNNGKTANVPYWYCRNSWKTTWGDGGYFKMAMYPYNKISQFDKQVVITDQQGVEHLGGGFVLLSAQKKPEKKTLSQINQQFMTSKRLYDDSYYKLDPNISQINIISTIKNMDIKILFILLGILILILLIVGIIYLIKKKGMKLLSFNLGSVSSFFSTKNKLGREGMY